jgi:hypothetical protein
MIAQTAKIQKNLFHYEEVKRIIVALCCGNEDYLYFCRGELAEWSIAAVLKTVDV